MHSGKARKVAGSSFSGMPVGGVGIMELSFPRKWIVYERRSPSGFTGNGAIAALLMKLLKATLVAAVK